MRKKVIIFSFVILFFLCIISYFHYINHKIKNILQAYEYILFDYSVTEFPPNFSSSNLRNELYSLPAFYSINKFLLIFNDKSQSRGMRLKSLCSIIIIAQKNPYLSSPIISNILEDVIEDDDKWSLEALKYFYKYVILVKQKYISMRTINDCEKIFYADHDTSFFFYLFCFHIPFERIKPMTSFVKKNDLLILLDMIDEKEKKKDKEYCMAVKEMLFKQMDENINRSHETFTKLIAYRYNIEKLELTLPNISGNSLSELMDIIDETENTLGDHEYFDKVRNLVFKHMNGSKKNLLDNGLIR